MSDSRRRYDAIRSKLLQLYPQQPTGRQMQSLTVLMLMISGIVGSKSTQTRQVAKQSGESGKVESRSKRIERWYRHDGHTYEVHYLPYVRQLLSHLAVRTVVVAMDGSDVGRGCMVTMVNLEVALSAPRRVRSLTLINGSYGQIFDRALQPWMRLPGIPRVLHRVVETLASHEWIADRIGALTLNPLHISAVGYMISKAWGNPKIRPMYAQYVSDVFGESFHNYLRLFQALDAHSSYYLLPEVTQPTLVISGGLDWLTPASMSRRIARRIPGAEHLHLPLASHFALLEYSDEVVERMQAFLQPLRVHAGGSNTAAA